MVQKNYWLLLALIVPCSILFSCSNKENKETNLTTKADSTLSGRYVNVTVLNSLPELLAGEIPSYCFEMNFFSHDSVEIFCGFEEAKLAYKKNDKGYSLLSATFKGDMPFAVSDSTLTLMDTMWTRAASFSKFKKVPDSGNKKWLFDWYLNKQMITGEYQLYDTNGQAVSKVIFTPEGSVSGLFNYTSYEICYSGDCMETADVFINTIYFSGNKLYVDYAFTIDKNNKEITFYELAPPIEDIKGERPVLGKAFSLKRQ